MDAFQRLPGGAVPNPLSTTTGTQPAPSSQGQYLRHDVTSPPGTPSTPGMAPVSPHARSTSQLSPARVSALSGATGSGTSTGQQGISVAVNDTGVVVKNGSGETLYSVAKGDSRTKPDISVLNLAVLAICQQPGKKATIRQMAAWVKKNIHYYEDDVNVEARIYSALMLRQTEFQTEIKGSGESRVKFWALKDEETYFKYAGPFPHDLSRRKIMKCSSVNPDPRPAPGISPVSFDTPATGSQTSLQPPPATASAPEAASGSGTSAIQQRLSVTIGLNDILLKDSNGKVVFRVLKGDAKNRPSTSQIRLIAVAICHQDNKKATARQIVLWLKNHIPHYEKKQYDEIQLMVSRELSYWKNIFKSIPFSADKVRPYFWQLINETAYFQGSKTTKSPSNSQKKRPASATPESQPPAAKKRHSQPEISAGTLSVSDAPMGGHLQPLQHLDFSEYSSAASHQPASTGPIPPVSYLFSGEHPVQRDQPVGPESFYPGPAIPSSFPPHYPGVRYQPAGPGAYPGPPPPYPFSGGDPMSYPQPFPGTVYPMPPAAFGDFPYEPEPGSFTDSALPPYYPPVVVTTANH